MKSRLLLLPDLCLDADEEDEEEGADEEVAKRF